VVAGRAVRFTPASGNGVNWGCDHALTLTLADDSDPVSIGDTLTYHLNWNLTGFGGAPQAVLTAQVPANSSFVSASGGITPSGGTLTWNLGNLRPNALGTAWFTVTANSGPVATTTATISDALNQTRSATQSTVVGALGDDVFANGFE